MNFNNINNDNFKEFLNKRLIRGLNDDDLHIIKKLITLNAASKKYIFEHYIDNYNPTITYYIKDKYHIENALNIEYNFIYMHFYYNLDILYDKIKIRNNISDYAIFIYYLVCYKNKNTILHYLNDILNKHVSNSYTFLLKCAMIHKRINNKNFSKRFLDSVYEIITKYKSDSVITLLDYLKINNNLTTYKELYNDNILKINPFTYLRLNYDFNDENVHMYIKIIKENKFKTDYFFHAYSNIKNINILKLFFIEIFKNFKFDINQFFVSTYFYKTEMLINSEKYSDIFEIFIKNNLDVDYIINIIKRDDKRFLNHYDLKINETVNCLINLQRKYKLKNIIND